MKKLLCRPQRLHRISVMAVVAVMMFMNVQAQQSDAIQPYIPQDQLPNLLNIMPAPPAFDSPEFSNDVVRYGWGKQQRENAERLAVAIADAEWNDHEKLYNRWKDAFGLEISETATPEIWKLLETSLATTDPMRKEIKAYYHRQRPFERFNDSMPSHEEDALRGEGSYPSGHSLRGWTISLLLAQIAPERASEIYRRGWDYCNSRVIVGAHWQSDVDNSRTAASVGFCCLQGNAAFQAQMAKARQEYKEKAPKPVAQFIPQAPDYNNAKMWITKNDDPKGTGADVFYVVSTWEEDWKTTDGMISHYADVWNPTHREHMASEINRVAAYMAPGNRFYAPFYRHATIETFMLNHEATTKARARMAMEDVCNAFDHFLKKRDKRRPLIIAGFSQGGMAVVELLKYMSDNTYKQLAAAYVIGYKVTPEDMQQTTHIKAAQGESDTGVTICYNTVKDVKYINPVLAASSIAINPVNWRTDATPATLHDSITVTLDPMYHALVVKGYSGAEYPAYKGFINVGDIHSCEPWLYSECLRKNISVRSKAKNEKTPR